MNNIEVGLFGTCNDSTWRDAFIPLLECDYFNPVVKDWNEDAQKLEIEKRETCDYILYTITPKMTGVYSIAECVYDACNRPEKTLFCVVENDDENEFTESQLNSLKMTKKMVADCGARVFDTLEDAAEFLNYMTNK